MVPGVPFDISVVVTLPPGYYQDVHSPFLSFEPTGLGQVTGRTNSPPQVREGKESFTGAFTLTRSVVLPLGTPAGSLSLDWMVGWQICQVDGVCLLPGEKTLSHVVQVAPSPDSSGGTFWLALLAALGGGALLNLMPCVFPVLALKGLGLASAAGLTLGQRRREALAFATGSFLALTGLGLVTAVVAALGTRLDWGFLFQLPGFVWALALAFWFFTLQLWGVWTWRGSPFTLQHPLKPSSGRSLVGGAFLVVAAAPCTAPLLGPALGFALTQPPVSIPIFFAAVGLGLVAPLLALSWVPGWTKLLPRPGAWMVLVERVAGYFLAATVVYLLWVFTQQTSEDHVWPALGLLGLAAGALGLWGKFPSNQTARLVALGMGLALLLGSMTLTRAPEGTDALITAQPSAAPPSWSEFSPTALEQALASGRPVLVDATAAWCVTCQVNEWAILNRPDVVALMDTLGLIRLRADYTKPEPNIKAWLTSVKRAGLPVYALYRPGQPVYLFPELLTEDNFTRILPRMIGYHQESGATGR